MRHLLVLTGTLLMVFAGAGAVLDEQVNKVGVPLFFAAVLVLHDAVFLPSVLGGGALIGRLVPPRRRGRVRGAAVVSLTVALVAVPLAAGPGDLPYGRGLLVILALTWLAALTVPVRRERNRHG